VLFAATRREYRVSVNGNGRFPSRLIEPTLHGASSSASAVGEEGAEGDLTFLVKGAALGLGATDQAEHLEVSDLLAAHAVALAQEQLQEAIAIHRPKAEVTRAGDRGVPVFNCRLAVKIGP